MTRRPLFSTAFVLAAFTTIACGKKETTAAGVQVVPVTRRDITISTEATGTVEPVDTVAIKSQASGLITRMPIEVGTYVRPGDLLAQIDTRNLRNDYEKAAAAQAAAKASLDINTTARKRADALFAEGVITAVEHEAAVVAEANSKSQLVAAQTNLKVAAQNLEYATLRSEVAGTVISKSASVGTVVSSAISTFGGGSTIVTVADLSRVRMRVLVNETDIAGVHPGQTAVVTIDALPNKQFTGIVEKIEPQATVQQSVTMFPVLVSLENADRVLLPGMNGEVSMVLEDRKDVLAVPNDAVRGAADIMQAGAALGVNPDSLRAGMQRRQGGGAAGAGGMRAGSARAGSTSTDASAPRGGAMGGGEAQFVFVKQGTTFVPRRVRLGVTNFDYSEVLSGLKEGDQVALLSTALVQAQRERSTQRARNMTSGPLSTGGKR